MAEKDMPSFAVDADITPLQGRYFQNVQSRISDPRLRTQAYGLIKQTFGGIQQARDIQRARQQEEEDRALNMDVRRAQLEQRKLELSLAREKFRRQQESVVNNSKLYTDLDSVKDDPSLTPAQKLSRLNEVAAANVDTITNDQAAQNRFNFTANAVKALAPPKSSSPSTTLTKMGDLYAKGVNRSSLGDLGYPVNDPAAIGMLDTIDATNKAQQTDILWKQQDAVDKLVKRYKDPLESLSMASKLTSDNRVAAKPESVDWVNIDDMLFKLDALGLVDQESKKELVRTGVAALSPEDPGLPAKVKSPQEYAQRNKDALRAINNVIRKAASAGTSLTPSAPAPTKPGINVNSLTQ